MEVPCCIGTCGLGVLTLAGLSHTSEYVATRARKVTEMPKLMQDAFRMTHRTAASNPVHIEGMVECSVDGKPAKRTLLKFDGEALLLGPDREGLEAAAALGGATIQQREDSAIIVSEWRAQASRSLEITFDSVEEATLWSSTLRGAAARLPPPPARIRELREQVVDQELHISDLEGTLRRTREKMDKIKADKEKLADKLGHLREESEDSEDAAGGAGHCHERHSPRPKAAPAGAGQKAPFLNLVSAVPWGVLGSQLTRDNQVAARASEPDLETAIVDPAGLSMIQEKGPGEAGGAAGAIYRFLGIQVDAGFPLNVVKGIRKATDAKLQRYANAHVIHAVGPDLRFAPYAEGDKSLVTEALTTAYANVLREFAASGLRRLRLLPLSGGIFSGAYAAALPELTALSLSAAFSRLGARQRESILATGRIELCIFAEQEFEHYAEALRSAQQQQQAGSDQAFGAPGAPPPPAAEGAFHNIIMLTDSYKVTHHLQYPPGTETIYSYFECRGGAYQDVCFFGLQYYLKKYLCGPVVTMAKIDQAEAYFKAHFKQPVHGYNETLFNRAAWEHIVREHSGRLPVLIKAVPEGTVLPYKNVLFTMENTDPRCYWLTNYLETLLVQVWYPTTVCTQSREQKKIITQYLQETGSADVIFNRGHLFKLHDFGLRGVSSVESAAAGGAAHLVNFRGTDTMVALALAKEYYYADCAGFSIPASEHSTITSWGRERECDAMRNMLDKYPNGIMACVSDSYDVFKACEEYWGTELRTRLERRDGIVVVRPDSGELPDVVLQVLDCLERKFGTQKTSTGHKLLPHYIRVIQGDGIDINSLELILRKMKEAGWAADNLAFGSGGALLQKLHRDTQKCAFKCSHAIIAGEGVDVVKMPITDPGKMSKKGRLTLELREGRWTTVTGGRGDPASDRLVEVFRNGRLLVDDALDAIRRRAEGEEVVPTPTQQRQQQLQLTQPLYSAGAGGSATAAGGGVGAAAATLDPAVQELALKCSDLEVELSCKESELNELGLKLKQREHLVWQQLQRSEAEAISSRAEAEILRHQLLHLQHAAAASGVVLPQIAATLPPAPAALTNGAELEAQQRRAEEAEARAEGLTRLLQNKEQEVYDCIRKHESELAEVKSQASASAAEASTHVVRIGELQAHCDMKDLELETLRAAAAQAAQAPPAAPDAAAAEGQPGNLEALRSAAAEARAQTAQAKEAAAAAESKLRSLCEEKDRQLEAMQQELQQLRLAAERADGELAQYQGQRGNLEALHSAVAEAQAQAAQAKAVAEVEFEAKFADQEAHIQELKREVAEASQRAVAAEQATAAATAAAAEQAAAAERAAAAEAANADSQQVHQQVAEANAAAAAAYEAQQAAQAEAQQALQEVTEARAAAAAAMAAQQAAQAEAQQALQEAAEARDAATAATEAQQAAFAEAHQSLQLVADTEAQIAAAVSAQQAAQAEAQQAFQLVADKEAEIAAALSAQQAAQEEVQQAKARIADANAAATSAAASLQAAQMDAAQARQQAADANSAAAAAAAAQQAALMEAQLAQHRASEAEARSALLEPLPTRTTSSAEADPATKSPTLRKLNSSFSGGSSDGTPEGKRKVNMKELQALQHRLAAAEAKRKEVEQQLLDARVSTVAGQLSQEDESKAMEASRLQVENAELQHQLAMERAAFQAQLEAVRALQSETAAVAGRKSLGGCGSASGSPKGAVAGVVTAMDTTLEEPPASAATSPRTRPASEAGNDGVTTAVPPPQPRAVVSEEGGALVAAAVMAAAVHSSSGPPLAAGGGSGGALYVAGGSSGGSPLLEVSSPTFQARPTSLQAAQAAAAAAAAAAAGAPQPRQAGQMLPTEPIAGLGGLQASAMATGGSYVAGAPVVTATYPAPPNGAVNGGLLQVPGGSFVAPNPVSPGAGAVAAQSQTTVVATYSSEAMRYRRSTPPTAVTAAPPPPAVASLSSSALAVPTSSFGGSLSPVGQMTSPMARRQPHSLQQGGVGPPLFGQAAQAQAHTLPSEPIAGQGCLQELHAHTLQPPMAAPQLFPGFTSGAPLEYPGGALSRSMHNMR